MRAVSELEKERCTGCGACSNACPNGCISMTADEEGFLYPAVAALRCNDCGICAAVCPVINSVLSLEKTERQVYAAWSLDARTRYHSTSGGIFTELAKSVLQEGGLVAGARYNERHMVSHALIEHKQDLSLLQQSKYVQSDTNLIYQNVRTALSQGRQVLFAGTPCQCAAMKRFAGRTDSLLLCDFICRGVNSPLVYAKYLEELEKRYGAKIGRVWFKNKRYGWNDFGTQIEFDNGEVYFSGRDQDPFMFGYIRKDLNLYMRPSCGQCGFKSAERSTDVTLGDFWGVKLYGSDDDIKQGVSAVMVHTHAGRRLFEKIRQSIYAEEHTLHDIIYGNVCLTKPAINDPKNRIRFWEAFYRVGFHGAISQFIEKEHVK